MSTHYSALCTTTMPSLVLPTGEISEEFARFLSAFEECIKYSNWSELYKMTDMAYYEDEFCDAIKSAHGKHWEEYRSSSERCRGLSITVDAESFNEISSCQLARIHVITYMLVDGEGGPITQQEKTLQRHHMDWWFTYKRDKFVIVSAIPEVKIIT